MLLWVLWRPKTEDCCYLWPLECIKPNLVYPNFVHGGSVEILQIFLCVWVENNAIVVWACAWWAIIVVGFEFRMCWGMVVLEHRSGIDYRQCPWESCQEFWHCAWELKTLFARNPNLVKTGVFDIVCAAFFEWDSSPPLSCCVLLDTVWRYYWRRPAWRACRMRPWLWEKWDQRKEQDVNWECDCDLVHVFWIPSECASA